MDEKIPDKRFIKLYNFGIRVLSSCIVLSSLRRKFRNKHLIDPAFIDNYIYIIDNEGNKKRIFQNMKNVKLRFTGKNNIVELPNSHFCALFNIQEDNSYIKIGKNFSANDVTFRLIEGNSTVIIGDDCMFSCNIDILSSDGHVIMRKGEVRPYNQPKPVIIGNHVWVGYNVKILKGTEIADNTILGACSVVSGKFNEPNVIIAGNPARVVKQDIDWNSLPHVMYNATLEKMLVGACN